MIFLALGCRSSGSSHGSTRPLMRVMAITGSRATVRPSSQRSSTCRPSRPRWCLYLPLDPRPPDGRGGGGRFWRDGPLTGRRVHAQHPREAPPTRRSFTGRRKPTSRPASVRDRWSRHSDLNRGPAVYETAALPLSYVGARASIGDAPGHQLFTTRGATRRIPLTRKRDKRGCLRAAPLHVPRRPR